MTAQARTGAADATRSDGPAPLSGIVVIEAITAEAPDAVGHAIGLCGRVALDLGARVVRIEPTGGAASPTDRFLNAGKERFAVDAARRADLIGAMTARCDAVVCDPVAVNECAAADAVRVVVGVARDEPLGGSEFTIEARSGLLDLVGDADRSPLRLGGHQTAYAGGLAAYLALVSGLCARRDGARVGTRRVDLLDVAVWLNWKTLAVTQRTGHSPRRAGPDGEWTVLPCRDGFVAIVYRVPEWPALQRLVDDPALADERFQSVAGRRRHRRALNAILARAFADRTRAEIHEEAVARKLPLGPVWSPEELLRDRHMLARDAFRRIGPSDGVSPNLPVKWNGRTPGAAVPVDVAG